MRTTEFESQQAMRFGPRSYTPEQGEVIEEAVRTRRPLPEPPLPIDDDGFGSTTPDSAGPTGATGAKEGSGS